MEYINISYLRECADVFKMQYQSQQPYRFLLIEHFFNPDKALEVYAAYPSIQDGKWDGTTYLDQKNKFQKRKFETNSVMDKVFKELNSLDFLNWLQDLTEIEEPLLPDPELFGGGLHQSTNGAYLNVHVDYNYHPTTKYHRRLNVLVYMNEDWKDEYEGHLELWDFTDNKQNLLAKVAPTFNRCVIFETNEISFHGHPKPLRTPPDVNRKSLATYYYTVNRPAGEINLEHNTIFVNTEGVTGQVKRFTSGIKALFERIRQKL